MIDDKSILNLQEAVLTLARAIETGKISGVVQEVISDLGETYNQD